MDHSILLRKKYINPKTFLYSDKSKKMDIFS